MAIIGERGEDKSHPDSAYFCIIVYAGATTGTASRI